MKWYFVHPDTREMIYLRFEEKFAELAWDFRHRKGLSFVHPIEEAEEDSVKAFEDLYGLDKKEAREVIRWVYYFQLNGDSRYSEDITIKGE